MNREKIEAHDAQDREDVRQRFRQTACTANRCSQGCSPCPCPEACRLPEDGAWVAIGMGACVVAAVSVCALIVMVFA